jgi:hypothetical protein
MNTYLENLFNDPIFASVLAIISIWYSFYLFSRPPKRKKIHFITMTNHEKFSPRETTIVIVNSSKTDFTNKLILPNHPFVMEFKETITVSDISI